MAFQAWRGKQKQIHAQTQSDTHRSCNGLVSKYLNISKTGSVVINQNKSDLLRVPLNSLSVIPSLNSCFFKC